MQLPLHDTHLELGAKMMAFGDWQVPLRYRSALDEHHQVREHCGLFDVSHMGELVVKGKGAMALLQRLTINDVERLQDGQGQYTAMLNERGGFIDDLILYRLTATHFLLCVNAANAKKCLEHIFSHHDLATAEVSDCSQDYCQFALQGPASDQCLAALRERCDLPPLARMAIVVAQDSSPPFYIACTGYTGEHGYELYVPREFAAQVWRELLASDAEVTAVGFAARDTLRIEACFPLYGNDIDADINPYEAGLGWVVKLNAKDFIGKIPLLKSKQKGKKRQLVAFQMRERGYPRAGMEIVAGKKKCGRVTSGSILPSVGGCGGLALLTDMAMQTGDKFCVDIRGQHRKAVIVDKPHYKAKSKEQ